MLKTDARDLGPILSIRFVDEDHLELEWNLAGIVAPNTEFYHVFAFIGCKAEEATNLMQSYCRSLKMGEIVGVYSSRNYGNSHISWAQIFGQHQESDLFKKSCLLKNMSQDSMSQITKGVQSKRGMVIINLLFGINIENNNDFLKTVIMVEQYVSNLRSTNKEADKVIYNLVSSKYQKCRINNTIGVNYINYEVSNLSTTLDSLKALFKTTILKSLQITIQCQETQHVLSCNCNDWKVSDRSEIIKKYLAVTKIKFEQQLFFFQPSCDKMFNTNLLITLNLTFFDGSEIRDRKNVQFSCNMQRLALKTFSTHGMDERKIIQLSSGIFFETSILKKQSNVLLNAVDSPTRKPKFKDCYV